MTRPRPTTTAVSRWWRGVLTIAILVTIVASACAPAATPPAPTAAPATKPTTAAAVAPTAAPATKPTTAAAVAPTAAPAAAKPTAAPAPAPTAAPAAAATAAPAAKPSEVLKVVLGAELSVADPQVDSSKSSLVVDNTILETLAMNTPEQKFKPWLVESWEAVAPTKWRLKLKKGVKFHNGEPFNAEAVAFSFDLYVNSKGMQAGQFSFVAGTEKVDDYTVDVITKEPNAILPSSLAALYAYPPKYYKEASPQEFGRKPVGTGPYKFVEWTKGVQLKVTANPDYWGKKPPITDIQFRWAPEASSRVALLETGDVHIAQNIPPALIERVEKSSTARIEAVKSIRKVFLMINTYREPTKDVRLRKALNHAIDVDTVIKTLFKGRAYGRDKGIIHEGFEGYQGDKLQPYKFDPDLAKKLLAEAGFPNGLELPFWYPIGRYMLDKESSEAMAAYLNKVGIKTDLRGMEPGAYFPKLTAADADKVPGINFFSCGPLFMNPMLCALVYFQPGAPQAYGADERTGALIKKAGATLNDADRAKVYQELENYVYNDFVPWVWLWHQQDVYGVSNKVNWKPRSDELIIFEDVAFK